MAKVVRKSGDGAKKLAAMLAGLDTANARVGWLETAKYPDKNKTPAAYVAVIHENGVEEKGLPPRPMFAPTIIRCADDWVEKSRQLAKRVSEGKLAMKGFLTILADQAARDVQETIREISSPPLAEKTILARRRAMEHQEATEGGNTKVVKSEDDPLMRTEFLHDSVQFDVSDGTRSEE